MGIMVRLDSNDMDWPSIHTRNFKCTIETQLKSFYFKLFHNAIAVKSFLFKIYRVSLPCAFFVVNTQKH